MPFLCVFRNISLGRHVLAVCMCVYMYVCASILNHKKFFIFCPFCCMLVEPTYFITDHFFFFFFSKGMMWDGGWCV